MHPNQAHIESYAKSVYEFCMSFATDEKPVVWLISMYLIYTYIFQDWILEIHVLLTYISHRHNCQTRNTGFHQTFCLVPHLGLLMISFDITYTYACTFAHSFLGRQIDFLVSNLFINHNSCNVHSFFICSCPKKWQRSEWERVREREREIVSEKGPTYRNSVGADHSKPLTQVSSLAERPQSRPARPAWTKPWRSWRKIF
jgi:hypothetical protein